jgi:hypothetical protein
MRLSVINGRRANAVLESGRALPDDEEGARP